MRITYPIREKLNEASTKWFHNGGTKLVNKAVTVGQKRKRRLVQAPSVIILGPLVGLLILGGLACSPDKGTPDIKPPEPASSLPQPLPQPRTDNVSDYIESTNPLVRDTAVLAVQSSPADIEVNSEIWKIWKINYWVANNISYVSDPKGHNYFAYAHETLQARGGDCDDFSILLASMYEAVGLDAAIASIDTDDDVKPDHMSCLVYYPEDGDTFIEEEMIILEMVGLDTQVRVIYFDPAKSKLLPEKYTTGVWIVADPTMAMDKDKVGYVIHKPYKATLVIDVGS